MNSNVAHVGPIINAGILLRNTGERDCDCAVTYIPSSDYEQVYSPDRRVRPLHY